MLAIVTIVAITILKIASTTHASELHLMSGPRKRPRGLQ